jgi:hypothetical protein
VRVQHKRIFIAGEGESEQSFIKWLQELSEQNGLHVHLDCVVLGGGGYESMLNKMLRHRKYKERPKPKLSALLVDSDRAERKDDGWTIEQLKQKATKKAIRVYVQQPNLEGWLLRMMPGQERRQPNVADVQRQLRNMWDGYRKPADARTLALKFSLSDLVRVARVDSELKNLLGTIGLFT